MNVLIAEDQMIFTELIKATLNEINNDRDDKIEILGIAKDGIEFGQILLNIKNNKIPVHLALIDLRMPNMDGLTMLAKLKLVSDGIKVIIVSSENVEDFQKLALIPGSERTDDDLVKTFEKLSGHVEKILLARNINEEDLILNFCTKNIINPFWAGEALGADAYVKKPYTKEALQAAINFVLGNPESFKVF